MTGASPIHAENQRPGTLAWLPTNTRLDGPRVRQIEAWCSHPSARAGEKITFYVSVDPAAPFTIDVYRLGYYAGTGARHVTTLAPHEGRPQPTPESGTMRVRECVWEPSAELTIPPDWLSGVYLAQLTTQRTGVQSYVLFVVRDDRQADLIVQVSDFTWQAYNRWPASASMYDKEDGPSLGEYWGPNVAVSLDRPHASGALSGFTPGTAEFFAEEFPFHYWLERHGYDATYVSNLDTHRDPAGLRRAAGFVSVGHDEYYTLDMYENLLAAVQDGLSIAFLSGNTCCGRIEPRPASDGRPDRVFSRIDRFGPRRADDLKWFPDNALFPNATPSEALLIGARSIGPIVGMGNWICTAPDHWIYEGTAMKAGEAIPNLVGFEFHGDPVERPGLEIVSTGPTRGPDIDPSVYTATVYLGAKDNVVFNASSIWWATGLSWPPGFPRPMWSDLTTCCLPDSRVQRITRNVLDRMITARATG